MNNLNERDFGISASSCSSGYGIPSRIKITDNDLLAKMIRNGCVDHTDSHITHVCYDVCKKAVTLEGDLIDHVNPKDCKKSAKRLKWDY